MRKSIHVAVLIFLFPALLLLSGACSGDTTATPQLNLHDVNGDGIDDFVLGAPGNADGGVNAGAVYYFEGKETWEDVNLETQSADAKLYVDGGRQFGWDAKVIGDFNGDGYADVAMSSPTSSLSFNNEGLLLIYPGSANGLSDTILSPTSIGDPIAILRGTAEDEFLGWGIQPVGDVNGDELTDFIVASLIAAQASTRYWLLLGRTTAFPDPATFPLIDTVADAAYIVEGSTQAAPRSSYIPVASCDINGDELNDLIIGAPAAAGGGTLRGKTFVVAGSTNPTDIDLRTQAASAEFSGPMDNATLGSSALCGDVNGDGLVDLLIGAALFDTTLGRSYFVAGNGEFRSIDFSSANADATYTGGALTALGAAGCIPGDVNDDGYDDPLIGAPFSSVSGSNNIGRTFLFLGSAAPASVDLGAGGTADATYSGEIPATGGTGCGYCKTVGDVNNDGVPDILLGAPATDAGGDDRGQAYLIFGEAGITPPSIDFNVDNTADVTITGAGDDNFLSVEPSP